MASLLGSLRCFLVFSGVLLLPESDAIRFICGEVLLTELGDGDLYELGIVDADGLEAGSLDRLVLNKGAILTG